MIQIEDEEEDNEEKENCEQISDYLKAEYVALNLARAISA